MSDEQRKWPRMNLALEVRMRFDSVEDAISARTTNISREGLFLRMDPPKPLGTKVRAQVHIGAESFQLEGVVVHVNPDPEQPEPGPYGVGVFLTAASEGWAKVCEELSERRRDEHLANEFPDEDTSPDSPFPITEKVRGE